MDGYALRAADTAGALPDRPAWLPVLTGEITAGRAEAPPLAPGQAVRIMTGAPLPAGADAVVRGSSSASRSRPGATSGAGARNFALAPFAFLASATRVAAFERTG